MASEVPQAEVPQADDLEISPQRASELVGLMYAENIGFQNAAPQLSAPNIREDDTPEILAPVMRKAIEVVLKELKKPTEERSPIAPEFTLKKITTLQKLKDPRLNDNIQGIMSRQTLPHLPFLGFDRQNEMHQALVDFRRGDSVDVQIALGSIATAQVGETKAREKTLSAIRALYTAQKKS